MVGTFNENVDLYKLAQFEPNDDLSPPIAKSRRKMKFSGRQVAAARELLGLSQTELATATGVARRTIIRFETGEADLKPATLQLIETELQQRGIEFTNGDGAGVRINYAKAAEFARLSAQSRNNIGQ